jgi:hypothetical protein
MAHPTRNVIVENDAVADILARLREISDKTGASDYQILAAIECAGELWRRERLRGEPLWARQPLYAEHTPGEDVSVRDKEISSHGLTVGAAVENFFDRTLVGVYHRYYVPVQNAVPGQSPVFYEVRYDFDKHRWRTREMELRYETAAAIAANVHHECPFCGESFRMTYMSIWGTRRVEAYCQHFLRFSFGGERQVTLEFWRAVSAPDEEFARWAFDKGVPMADAERFSRFMRNSYLTCDGRIASACLRDQHWRVSLP